MNIVSRCISFLLLVSLSAPGLAWQSDGAVADLRQRQSLSPKEAAQFKGENVIFLDVRSTLEWLGGHVEGAIHLPYDEVSRDIASVLPDRSVPVITYCASGGRASFVVEAMRKQGYTVVPVVGGGYRELIVNGLPKD